MQGQQGASLQLTARLQTELANFKPTLAINNGDIAYARHDSPGCPVSSTDCAAKLPLPNTCDGYCSLRIL